MSTWYLPDGITNAHCIAAYIPRASSSYANSLINKAHPGTHDATDQTFDYNENPQTSTPGWDPAHGWVIENDPSDYTVTRQCLNTGITTGDLGANYTVVAFVNGVPYNNVQTAIPRAIYGGMYSLFSADGNTQYVSDTTAWLYGNGGLCGEFFVNDQSYASDYFQKPGGNMLATIRTGATGTAYVDGASFGMSPIDGYQYADAVSPHIYIGAISEVDYNSDGSVRYTEYSYNGLTGNVAALLMLNVALTQAQLDSIRLAYNLTFNYAAVLRRGA